MNSIGKFAMGTAMGFMVGASMMLMPVGSQLRRDMKRKTAGVKRMLKNL